MSLRISNASFSPALHLTTNAEQNAAQSRLQDLKKALNTHSIDGKLEPSYARYLESELRDIATQLKEDDVLQFQSTINTARFRFVMADIELALGIAREFTQTGNLAAADAQFERARQLVREHSITSIDIEARIRKAKTNPLTLQSRN